MLTIIIFNQKVSRLYFVKYILFHNMNQAVINYNKDNSLKEMIGYVTIVLWIVWKPLTVWMFHFDSSQRLSICFALLSLVVFFNELKNIACRKHIWLICFVLLWGFLNALIKQSIQIEKTGFLSLVYVSIMTLIVFLVAIMMLERHFKTTLKLIGISMLIYCLIAMFSFSDISVTNERFETEHINSNEMAFYTAIGYGIILFRYSLKHIGLIGLFLLPIPAYITLASGSRMWLGIIFIISLGFVFSRINIKKPSSILLFVIGVTIVCYAGNYMLYNTIGGQRLMNTQDDINRTKQLATGTFWDLLGDRGLMYYYSWPLFVEHPITGIGLYNYKNYGWGSGERLHTEYAVQYVENGLVGFIPFSLFIILLVTNLIKAIRRSPPGINKQALVSILGVLGSILYANIMLWSFDMICVFYTYAISYVYPRLIRKSNNVIVLNEKSNNSILSSIISKYYRRYGNL